MVATVTTKWSDDYDKPEFDKRLPMEKVNLEQLAKLEHLNVAALEGRTVRLLPLWDGQKWHMWINAADGRIFPIQMADAAWSLYLTKGDRAKETDLHFPLIDLLWQRLSYTELARSITAIEDDFHLLATSAAKLEHFHATRAAMTTDAIESFVRSEIEYILIVARSLFDLVQEVISGFWNTTVQLLDPEANALKTRNKLPDEFAKVVITSGQLRTAQQIIERYALPPPVAERYVRHGAFFATLRRTRNNIVHGQSSTGSIFATEKGFAIMPDANLYRDFPWKNEHYYNDNLVSLMPWIARTIFQTMASCTDILDALEGVIRLPEEMAPGYRIMLRDPTNAALFRLLEAAEGRRIWWEPDAVPPT